MNDQYKTKTQLIDELEQTRTRVAELEQVEAALRGSEEKYRTLFENVSDQIIYVNKYGTILSASDRDTTFGRKPEEIIGKNFTKLGYFDVKDIPKYLKLFKDVITGKKTVVGMELGIKHKDGHKVPVEVSTSLVKKNGRIEGFLCIVRDITGRKRAEEEIKRRNEELSALNSVATVVSQSLNLDEILNTGLDKVLELMHLDVGGIYLSDPAGQTIDLAAYRGISKEFAHGMKSISIDEKSLEAVMAEGKLMRFILSVEAVIKDRVELKRILSAMKKEGLSLTSAVPVLLQAKEEILGVMTVGSRTPRQFSEAELELLTSIGQQIAIAIENARLYEEAQQEITERKRAEREILQRTEDLTLVNELNNAINRGESLQELIGLLSRETGDMFSSYGAAVYLLSEDSQYLIMQNLPLAQKTVNQIEKLIGRKLPSIKVPVHTWSLSREWLHSAKPQIISDPTGIRDWFLAFFDESNLNGKPLPAPVRKIMPQIRKLLGMKSILVVPLVSIGNAIGLLHIGGKKLFTESDLKRLEVLSGPLTAAIVRQRAEEALRESEGKYRSLVESTDDAVYLINQDMRYEYANGKYLTRLGLSLAELVGQEYGKLHPRDTNEEFVKEVGQVIKSGKPLTYEYLSHMDNRYFLRTLSPVTDEEQGEIRAITVTSKDITERKDSERALQENEEKYSQLFATVSDAIVIFNADTLQFIDVNPQALELYGYTRSEFLALKQTAISAGPEASELSISETLAGYRNRIPVRYHKKKEGTIFPVEITSGYYSIGDRKVVCGVMRDISERIQAEQAIKRHTEDLTLLNDLNRAVNADASLEEVLALLCERTKRIFSGHGTTILLLAEDESLEMKYMPLDRKLAQKIERLANMMIPPVKIPLKENTLHWQVLKTRQARLLRDGRSIQRQIREYVNPFTVPNKMARQVIKKLVPQIHRALGIKSMMLVPLISDNEVIGLINLASEDKLTETDLARLERLTEWVVSIIKHKQAEEELRESEARYRELADSITDVFFAMDKELTYTYWNRASEGLTGIPAKDALGKSLYELFPDTPQTKSAEKAYLGVLRTQQPKTFVNEYQLEGKDFFFEISAYPTREGISVFTRDITERKLAEEELKSSNKKLKQFAFAASHDLQEPLKTITSFAQLLSERYKGQLDSSVDEYLHYIVEGATQMSARIKGLLAVSPIEAKAVSLENVSLEAVLQQVLAGLKNLVEQSHAEITWDTLPEIRADRDQMAQLLQNLIENALKFRGTEDPRVHISSRTTTSTWEFCMQDNGIGIEPKYHERIFGLFHRVSRKDEHAGTGIGLAICQRIVERHGGRIWVESEGEGKGSRFYTSISKQVR